MAPGRASVLRRRGMMGAGRQTAQDASIAATRLQRDGSGVVSTWTYGDDGERVYAPCRKHSRAYDPDDELGRARIHERSGPGSVAWMMDAESRAAILRAYRGVALWRVLAVDGSTLGVRSSSRRANKLARVIRQATRLACIVAETTVADDASITLPDNGLSGPDLDATAGIGDRVRDAMRDPIGPKHGTSSAWLADSHGPDKVLSTVTDGIVSAVAWVVGSNLYQTRAEALDAMALVSWLDGGTRTSDSAMDSAGENVPVRVRSDQ